MGLELFGLCGQAVMFAGLLSLIVMFKMAFT